MYLQLRRRGQEITLAFGSAPGEWTREETFPAGGLGEAVFVGLATLSHDDARWTRASFDEIEITPGTGKQAETE